MSDLISREFLQTAIHKFFNGLTHTPTEEDIQRYIEVAPSVEDEGEPKTEWIPVSERLPKEENKRYWICTDCGYQCECRWTNVNHIWPHLTTDWHWHIMDVPQYSKVVAWMPLPEPYHETCKGCLEPCIMYEPDMRACKKKVTERGE